MDKDLRRMARFFRHDRLDGVQGISRRVASWFNDHLTGNQVTIIGVVLAIPALICFAIGWHAAGMILMGWHWAGVVTMIASLLTDFVDGALARYQQGDRTPMTLEEELQLSLWDRICYRGVTHLGKELDPGADKLRFVPLVWLFGWGVLWLWLMILITVVAMLLTLMRPLKRYYGLDGASTRIGKYKIWTELAGLVVMAFVYPFMSTVIAVENAVTAANVCFTISLIFAVGSLFSHVVTGVVELWRRRKERRRAPDSTESVRP